MTSQYKRSTSPGSRRLANPGRSSGSSISSSYDPYSSSSRSRYSQDPYSSKSSSSGGGVIPISTEVYDSYPPSRSSTSHSSRPRRSTLGADDKPSLAYRSRPTALVQENRPSSPLSRTYEREPAYVKPASTTKREHRRLYSVDDGTGSTRLISDSGKDSRYLNDDRDRRERRGYHLTGKSNRHQIEDSEFSYTDPEGMYRDTEPSWRVRERQGSTDDRKLRTRPSSMLDQFQPPSRSSTSRADPAPSKRRGYDDDYHNKSTSSREPYKTSSRDDREKKSSYDNYKDDDRYSSRSIAAAAAVIHQDRPTTRDEGKDHYRDRDEYRREEERRETRREERGGRRDDYQDDRREERGGRRDDYPEDRRSDRKDDRREFKPPERQFTDDQAPVRGFGIRVPSPTRDRYGSSSNESLDSKRQPPNMPMESSHYIPPAGSAVSKESSRSYDPPASREPERKYSRDDQGYPPSSAREDDRRSSRDDRGYIPLSTRDDRRKYSRDERPRDERPREERPRDERPRDDRPRDDRPYFPPPPREEERRRSPPSRDHDRDYGYEKPRERAQSPGRDRDRDRDYDQRRPRGNSGSSSSILPGATAAAAAVAGGAAIEERRREKREDDSQEHRHGTRRLEPHDREDATERQYSQRDVTRDGAQDLRRDQDRERRRDEQPSQPQQKPLDPDEEYRQRLQAAQLELSRSDLREGAGRDNTNPRHQEQRSEGGSRDEYYNPENKFHPGEEQNPRIPPAGQTTSNMTDRPMVDEPSEMESRLPGSYPREQQHQDMTITDLNATALVPRGSSPPHAGNGVSSPERRDTRVRIVEPAKEASPPPPSAPKSILRKPTERFPEHPNPIREGVAPLKDAKVHALMKERGIPQGAKWTKIDRKLVNPQALDEKHERFEERLDCVIVLRVLTKEEIQALADRTREIRDEREARYEREHKHRRRHHDEGDHRSHRGGRHRDDEPATDDDADVYGSGGRKKPLMIEG